MGNPFKPTAGAFPPLLVGRQEELTDFEESIEDGPGAPGLLTLVSGQRGTGKTVLLSAFEDIAQAHGWLTITETATAGLIGRLSAATADLIEQDSPGPKFRLKNLGVAPFSAEFEYLDGVDDTTWRKRLTKLTKTLESRETGLLIVIDEIHAGSTKDLRQLAADVQHLIKEGLPIGVAFAGIPHLIDQMLKDSVITFLRRAERVELDSVPLEDVRDALLTPITDSGRTIDDDALKMSVSATSGYPFMIQLVGYHVWRKAEQGHITIEAAEEGIAAAFRRLGKLVHEPALKDLSETDRTVLVHMAKDEGSSAIADVADRMGVGSNYAGVYRSRLINAGMIEEAGRGRVRFALPYMRDYLQEHATALIRDPLDEDEI